MQDIDGWLSDEVAASMRDLILAEYPGICVEIGVYKGKSLINSALALRQNGSGIIYGIDPWSNLEAVKGLGEQENLESNDHVNWGSVDMEAIHQECMRHIRENELEEYAVIIRAASQHCRTLFRRNSIDILYIDGGHSEEFSCRDVDYYLPRVKVGGHIWFDDAHWKSTFQATELLRTQCVLVRNFGYSHLYQKT